MKVIGLGDQVVDCYDDRKIMYPGGNALNFAVFANMLRADSAFLGVFGNDKEAECVISAIRALGIDNSRSKFHRGENGKTVVRLENGDRHFVFSNRCGVLREKGLMLSEEDYAYLGGFDLIHSGLYSYSQEECKRLSGMGKAISFDFSGDYTEEQLRNILPVVKYAFFSTSNLSDKEREELSSRALENGCELALCTAGEKGAFLYMDGKTFRQEANYVEAEDTMACGDAFITAFILNYLGERGYADKEKVILKALALASEFAAMQCMVHGSFGFGKEYGD